MEGRRLRDPHPAPQGGAVPPAGLRAAHPAAKGREAAVLALEAETHLEAALAALMVPAGAM